MKKELNKWQLVYNFGKNYATRERGWKEVRFGIIKIIKMPGEGQMLYSGLYKGFMFRFYIWLPIDY
jgi:hypothetical protein